MDGLSTLEAAAQMRHKVAHFIDFERSGPHARARIFPAQHLYQDAPLPGYFLSPNEPILIPRDNPPHRFVFLPDFSRCRLLVSASGKDYLRLHLEQNLPGPVPPADPALYLDSFAYWDYTTGHLVGVIRGTAVLIKESDKPWTVVMQQIVGTAGHELVRQTFTRALALQLRGDLLLELSK